MSWKRFLPKTRTSAESTSGRRSAEWMFIPAAVGLIVTWSDLKVILVPVLVITCITTVFVMVVTGRTAQAVMHLKENMAAQKMEKQD